MNRRPTVLPYVQEEEKNHLWTTIMPGWIKLVWTWCQREPKWTTNTVNNIDGINDQYIVGETCAHEKK